MLVLINDVFSIFFFVAYRVRFPHDYLLCFPVYIYSGKIYTIGSQYDLYSWFSVQSIGIQFSDLTRKDEKL